MFNIFFPNIAHASKAKEIWEDSRLGDTGSMSGLDAGLIFDRAWDGIWGINLSKNLGDDEDRFSTSDGVEFDFGPDEVNIYDYAVLILEFTLSFVGVLATLYIIFQGFRLLIGAGDIDDIKKKLTHAVLGLIIIIVSYAIINTLIYIFDEAGDTPGNSPGIESLPESQSLPNTIIL